MLKTRIRMKVLAEFSFLLITFLIIPIIPLLKIHQREPAFGIEKLENLKKSGYWLNCPRIHINNDNWSATPLPWIQNRTGIWSDPHIIENVTIDAGGSGSGILIENSNDFFIIKNCTVYNSGNGLEDAGIKLISVSNGILINNNFSSNNKYGMYLFDSDVNTVIGNTVNNNNEWGVYLWQSNNNTVSGNIANNNTYRGINLYLCDNNMISGNYVHNSTDYGIYIDTSNNNTISGNIVNNNIEYGMYIITSDNNIILENNAHKNSYVGIQLEGSFYNKILGNNVQNNSWSGICLYLSQENTVSGNIASNNGVDGGILLYEFGSYNTISGNIFKNNDYGIHLAAFCDNNTITENIILNNSITGLEITSSSCNNNSIYNNVFLNNTLHAKDDGSDNHWNTSLIGNYWDNYTGLDNAPFDGIGDIPYNISRTPLIRDFLPIFQNPIHNGSKIHINESGVNSLNWSQTALVKWWCMGSGTYSNPYLIEDLIIDAKNLGSGIFIENSNDYFIIRNCTVYNAGSVWYEAGIRLQSVSNGTIFENKVSNNNYDGIYLIDSSNNTISENTVKYNDYGIAMEDSSKNMVLGNIVENNRIRGIFLSNITNNTISGNTLNNNSNSGIALFPNSNNNTISGNIVNNSVSGIISISSYFNTISKNTVNNQISYGIYLDSSDNNTISENNVSITQYGIYLDYSNNNTISGNIVNNNTLIGVYLTSSNITTVSGNTAINNGNSGILLHNRCNGNSISGNIVNNNSYVGINLEGSCDNNTISRNNATNNYYGIVLVLAVNNNTVSGNNATNNKYGILFLSNTKNTVTGNIATKNDYGIHLEKSNYSIFSGNIIRDNDVSGVNISDSYSQYNLFYNNFFINNQINGIDNWINNYWNNSVIGNYWSDYPGSDLNDDDIGDIPYNKNGIIDYLPIWDDGDSIKPIIIINSPQDGTYCDEVPLINVSVFDANLDQIWYTVSNNTTKVLLQNNIEVYLDDTIWGNLPNGPFKIYFNANDSAGNTDNKNLTLYKHVGIWTLSPFIIDDLGNGDYTWLEASIQGWCRGSGTSSDPYIIKNIIIDSQNSGSCIEIKNSDAYVVVRNSTFSNSGIGVTDAGIRLDSSSNVKLLYDETSINNGYGIYLSYCQDILIEGCTINDNAKSGIMLYESDNNIIRNNTNTINSNSEYGIYLNASHSNQISGNTINYNLIGICFDSSSYNNITFNDLRFNSQHAILETGGSTGNFFDGNDPPIIPEGEGPSGIPLMFIYLIICVSIIAVVVVIGVVIAKKRSAIPKVDKKEKKREKERLKEEERLNKERLKEKQRLEKERLEKEKAIQKVEAKERRIEQDLQKSLLLVDNLIKENKIEQALRDLVEIQKEAQAQGLIDIVNKAEENIILCKKSKVDTVNRVKQTILTLGKKFTRLQLVDISETSGIKDQSLIESIIHNMIRNKEIHGQYFSTSQALALEAATAVPLEEKAKGLNVFISYSTLDTDYFQVSKIVRRLELYPEINEVLFWEVDSKQNIVEFMEETLNKSKAFVLFCSENSIKSDAVKGEWQSAYQMVKKGLMKIIPVYEDEDHIPKLLWQMLNVKFTPDDFEGFIQKLYEEILR